MSLLIKEIGRIHQRVIIKINRLAVRIQQLESNEEALSLVEELSLAVSAITNDSRYIAAPSHTLPIFTIPTEET